VARAFGSSRTSIADELVETRQADAGVPAARIRPLPLRPVSPPRNPRSVTALDRVSTSTLPRTPSIVIAPEPLAALTSLPRSRRSIAADPVVTDTSPLTPPIDVAPLPLRATTRDPLGTVTR